MNELRCLECIITVHPDHDSWQGILWIKIKMSFSHEALSLDGGLQFLLLDVSILVAFNQIDGTNQTLGNFLAVNDAAKDIKQDDIDIVVMG